jgi:hypothetical protein
MKGELWVAGDDAKASLVVAGSGRRLEIALTQPVTLTGLISSILGYFGLPKLQPGVLGEDGPWWKMLDQPVLPSLVLASEADSGASIAIEASFVLEPPFTFGGDISIGPVKIQLLPYVKVEAVYVEYDKTNGLGLKAKVVFLDQQPGSELPALTAGDGDGGGTAQIVSYPFAAPVPQKAGDTTFQILYFGLGQRFGPTVDVNAPDPLKAVIDALEKQLTSTDPRKLLTDLVKEYYHPDRDWYVGAHIAMRGLEIRFVFSDPVLYGIEITGVSGQFEGLVLEILYQKLGPDLGVYYGTLTLPTAYRTVNLGAVAVTFPSISIWVYTNGDFKISVGWPLGDKSIVIQAAEFIGGGGFYFAKVRSADNPGTQGNVDYQPVLEFGIAVFWGVGRSISQGPISAQLSLTVQGTFQGVLAWRAVNPTTGQPGSMSNPPDNYWFAASVGIIGILQGSVDLAIIKASISIRISATAGVAFQLGYKTIVVIDAQVEVTASIKIVFFTIQISFSAHFSTTFTLGSGVGAASMDGPQGDLAPFKPPLVEGNGRGVLALDAAPVRERYLLLASATPPPKAIGLQFVLHPTVVYDANAKAAPVAVAELLISAPGPDDPPGNTDFETLVYYLESWLLATYGPTWSDVAANLGEGWSPGPADFEDRLNTLLQGFAITLTGVDLTTQQPNASVAAFPMLPPLLVTADSTDVAFAAYSKPPSAPATPSDYPQVIDDYFEELSLNQLAPNGQGKPRLVETLDLALTGRAVADYVYTDYFLLLARELVHELTSGQVPKNPAAQLAGVGSRFLIHGLRLPLPSSLGGPDDLAATPTDALYRLTAQQLTLPSTGSSFQVSLSVNPNAPVETPGWQLAFPGGGASTTATVPLGTPPPAPDPNWIGGGTPCTPTTGASTLCPLAPLHPAPLWYGARTQIAWKSDAGSTAIVSLPDPLQQLAAERPTKIVAATTPPDKDGKATTVPCAPALLIRLPIERIRRWSDSDVGHSGGADPYVQDVYQLRATDDDTRALIERLLDAPGALTGATIQLLYPAGSGMTSDSASPPFLAKANLSTTNRPSMLWPRPFLRRLAVLEPDLGPVSAGVATADDRAAFLRLVWECSVTNALEFYVHYEGLPADVFAQGDTADVAFLVQLGAQSTDVTLESYANALIANTTTGLFIEASERTQVLPTYPAGCIGFELVRTRPEPDDNPYSAATLAALYTLLQFQILATTGVGGAPSFTASGWSQPVGASGDQSLDQYRCIVPVYRFVAPTGELAVQSTPKNRYGPVGGTPNLDLLLEDVFGNQLLCYPHQQAFPVLYADPLIPIDEWPGIHLTWDVSGCGNNLMVSVVASFQIGDVLGQDQVVIATPAPGTTVATSQIPVSGTVCNTADTVTVQVGEEPVQPVTVDAKTGQWSAPSVQLAQGDNTIKVVAVGPDKTSVSSVVTVTYKPALAGVASQDPATVVDTFATRAATALTRYATIVDQLADPGSSFAVYTTLAPPPIAIDSPLADATVDGPTLTVRGIVQDVTAKVSVNGVAAAVAVDGTYAADGVAVKAPENMLTATATYANGKTATATVRVWLRRGNSVVSPPSLPGDSGLLGSGAQVSAPLTTLLADVVRQLTAVAQGGSAQPVAPRTITFPLSLTPLKQRVDDVFPLGVYLTVSRAANLDAEAVGELPSIASVTSTVLAPQSTTFAQSFEAAFAGFDGAGGTLKLAQRSQSAASSNAVQPLWAMRWSATDGVLVDFTGEGRQHPADPVYFAPKPLSRVLAGGTVNVPLYDGELKKTLVDRTFAGVDLDLWAKEFLSTFESLLSPSMATAVAALAPDSYACFMRSKACIAEAISKWIAPVYADQVGDGDATAAELQFEQALLTSLTADYATGAIVQRPVWITVTGTAEEGAGLPPRLYGAIEPPPLWVKTPADGSTVSSSPVTVGGGVDSAVAKVTANGVQATLSNGTFEVAVPIQSGENEIAIVASDAAGNQLLQVTLHVTLSQMLAATEQVSSPAQYTFTSTQLPLVGSPDAQYLTFLASTAQSLATLQIPLTYHAAYLDHHFDVAEEVYGYTPSSWLKFALADTGSQLDFDLGTLTIPLPLRLYPPSPVLIAQTSTDPPANSTGGVVIASPTNGTIVNATTVRVTGRLPGPNLGVIVNNVPADVYEADGSQWFSVDALSLDQGESTITATARDGGGRVVGTSTVTVYDVAGLPLQQALEAVLVWNYQVTVSCSQDPHDELKVEVVWNGPLGDPSRSGLLSADEPTLFEALASFRSGFEGLQPFVDAAPELAFPAKATDVTKAQCIEALKDTALLIGAVEGAWSRHGLPGAGSASAQSSNDYVVQFASVADGKLFVLGKKVGDEEPPWPTINGNAPITSLADGLGFRPSPLLAAGDWVTKTYAYTPAPSLVFQWDDLAVLEVQNADARFSTVRNADLGDGRAVNPDFVLSTSIVRFPAPAVPSISVTGLGPFPSQQKLVDTLAQLFTPLLSIDTAVERVLRASASNAWDVAVGPGSAHHLRSRTPVVLVPTLTIPPALPEEADDPVTDFLTNLAKSIGTWFSTGPRTGTDQLLVLDVVVFGTLNGQETPLLQVLDVEFSLSSALLETVEVS